ncbi:MAG: Uma2 family endonuclease [Bryobacteraceae bacterium]|nr:Uma2 family endonuclease [Bryobacteraceae bacterium]
MATAPALPFVSLSEYLTSSYEPDRDYLDGILVERNVGKRKHSRLQALILNFLMSQEEQYAILVYPEQRIQLTPSRFRIHDVCVMDGRHRSEDIFTEPPLLVFEVVSPQDAFGELITKARRYREMGVAHICVADPWNHTLFYVDAQGSWIESASLTVSFSIRAALPPLTLDFAGLFSQLDRTTL